MGLIIGLFNGAVQTWTDTALSVHFTQWHESIYLGMQKMQQQKMQKKFKNCINVTLY